MARGEQNQNQPQEGEVVADPAPEVATGDAQVTEAAATTETAAAPKRQKDQIPEGFVSPVQFAHELDKHLGRPDGTTRPQVIYGFVKNSKTFPSQERAGFPKFIVNLAEALTWWDEKEARKSEREAAKAAAPATDAAPAEATEATA
jgi:uridine phosphorylase